MNSDNIPIEIIDALNRWLSKNIVFWVVLFVLSLSLGILCIVYLVRDVKKFNANKIYYKFAQTGSDILLFVSVAIATIMLFYISIVTPIKTYQSIYDLQNKAFVVYEGTFYCENTKSGSFITLPDKTKITLGEQLPGTSKIFNDRFYAKGKILYCEKSRIGYCYEGGDPVLEE
ncbi:MAG: hypothetical protein IKB86_05625 [Clostridia bacterium]|nr:hypothetical protein [Clostridia bacterium]